MTTAGVRLEIFTGSGMARLLPALADLRTEVFRDWPYLYDGDPAYEQEYLKVYSDNDRAMLALAFDNDKIIGASTCLPMIGAAPEIRAPLEAKGLDPNQYFYFGESVLLRAYRGHGLGVRFFNAREAHAIADNVCDKALFYAVRREPGHAARPVDAKPLDTFWRNRGFRPLPGVSCDMSWKELGMTSQISHTLDAWCKPLRRLP